MADLDRQVAMRRELFDWDQPGRTRRFTQDSPLLPDVWLAFATAPRQPLDLLINPTHGERAGLVAHQMRALVRKLRDLSGGFSVGRPRDWSAAIGVRDAGLGSWGQARARIVHMPGMIAARLYFNEVMRIVLPSTVWWREQMTELERWGFIDAKTDARDQERSLLSDRAVGALRSCYDETFGPGGDTDRSAAPGGQPPYAFLKLIRVADMVIQSHPAFRSDDRHAVELFASLYRDWPADPAHPPTAGVVWNVSLNRKALPAAGESARAMKADAARRLFAIDCSGIRWAVIDSGIDACHPAFEAREPGRARDIGGVRSRVLDTFDFAELRYLLDPDMLRELLDGLDRPAGPPDPGDHDAKALANLRRRLERAAADGRIGADDGEDARKRYLRMVLDRVDAGLEIDWATLEPLLRDDAPDTPAHPHGTQVAGTLAAHWQEPGEDAPRVVGVCPDLRLIDLRVLARNGDGDLAAHDLEVIAALKFVAYLNTRAGEPEVHGVNISISIEHDVERYACGSTRVCEECEALVSSGVVVVAAAGNGGYSGGGRVDDRFYRSGSITDPGNAEAVLTVGATHRERPHQYGVSYFSSRGPTGDGRRKPDLVAPGERILAPSPRHGRDRVDGTSFAAPHVSGAAAMLMARHSEFVRHPQRVKQILCETATDLGREPYAQGAGMLDVLRALQKI